MAFIWQQSSDVQKQQPAQQMQRVQKPLQQSQRAANTSPFSGQAIGAVQSNVPVALPAANMPSASDAVKTRAGQISTLIDAMNGRRPSGSRGTLQGDPGPDGSHLTTKMPNPADYINSFYDGLVGDARRNWNDHQRILQSQANQRLREADLINARMGRGIGGGYAMLQGAANANNMQEMTKARLAFEEQMRNLERDRFGQLTDERRRQEERGWQREDRAEDQRQRLIEMIASITGEVPSQEVVDKLLGGSSFKLPSQKQADYWNWLASQTGLASNSFFREDLKRFQNGEITEEELQQRAEKILGWKPNLAELTVYDNGYYLNYKSDPHFIGGVA